MCQKMLCVNSLYFTVKFGISWKSQVVIRSKKVTKFIERKRTPGMYGLYCALRLVKRIIWRLVSACEEDPGGLELTEKEDLSTASVHGLFTRIIRFT